MATRKPKEAAKSYAQQQSEPIDNAVKQPQEAPAGAAADITPAELPQGPANEPAGAMVNARAQQELQMIDILNQAEAQRQQQPQKIKSEDVMKATEILRRYKEGKARLEQKLIANEEFWKLRQWNYHSGDRDEFKPATAWLWSCIQSRYSDAMDSYPTCNFRPRQEDDKAEAKKLSSIVPVILEQNRYEETYSDIVWYMLKHGGCVQGVFWDGSKNNGLGDVSIKRIDFLSMFWEPGVTNIQDSEHVFTTELVSNRLLEQRYPQTVGHLSEKNITLARYLYDDYVRTDDKSVVVDWYYHTEYNGRRALQYCKFVNDIVLYSTENDTKVPTRTEMDPETGLPIIIPTGEPVSIRGLYDHGLYPFVVQDLYPVEGSLCGYGLTDIGRDTQIQIDVMNKAITDNTVVGSAPRYFVKGDGSVNEEEFMNTDRVLVHVAGNIGEENIRLIDSPQLSGIHAEVLQSKIEELKYITANQDVNNGGTPSGITAASAIAALQETAGKNARSSNKTFYRAYRDVVYQVVELIRQFYDVPRTFRIAPDDMEEQFVQYSNAGITPQQQTLAGMPMGFRKPEFDIEITAEKESPYKKMEQNELALNFYNQGFFNPQMADQAIACLEMMDFAHKGDVIQRIQTNGTIMEMMLQWQQLALAMAQKYEPDTAQQMAQMILEQSGQPVPAGEEVNLDGSVEEPGFMGKARDQARASTQTE